MFSSPTAPPTHVLTVSATGAPRGNIGRAQACWVTADTIAWKQGAIGANWDVALHYDANGGLALETDGVTGGTEVPLTYDPAGLSAAVKEKFPHIASYNAFHIPASRLAEVAEALKGQIAIDAKDGGGSLVDATGLQIQGVLDDLYTYNGALGATFIGNSGNVPTLRVWAFINQVRDLASQGVLPQDTAQALIDYANLAIEQLRR